MSRLTVEGEHEIYFDHYKGAGAATLLLMHPWGMSGEAWNYILPTVLKAGLDIITVDGRAFGRSDRDFADTSVDAMGSDLVRLLDHLDVDKVILNGWSHGGMVVTDAASKLAPHRLAGLVLTCAIAPRYFNDAAWHYGVDTDSLAERVSHVDTDRIGFLDQMVEAFFHVEVGDGVRDWFRHMMYQTGMRQGLAELLTLDQSALLSSLSCPTLVIGGRHDVLVPVPLAEHQASIYPNSQFALLETGHAPIVEDTDGYCNLLLDFISKTHPEYQFY